MTRPDARVTPSITTPDGFCLECGDSLDGAWDGDHWCDECMSTFATTDPPQLDRQHTIGDVHPHSDREDTE
ncbi:MAG: hypothetical protein V3S01_06800 [Dehalococcoidia bacterium]